MTYYASTDPERSTRKDALLSLVLDIEAGEFVSETIYIYDEVSGGYGELAPDPEGIIVPDVLTISADGEQVWEPTTDVGLYSDVANLTYEFVPLDSGHDHPGRPDDLRLRWQRQRAEHAGRGAVGSLPVRRTSTRPRGKRSSTA